MKTLSDAFEHTLQDIYYAENALVKALPKVQQAANGKKLKDAIGEHLEETKGQIKMLEQVFQSIGKKASGEKCDAIEGLIKETDGIRPSSTTRSPVTAPCANGPRCWVTAKRMTC